MWSEVFRGLGNGVCPVFGAMCTMDWGMMCIQCGK